MAENVRAATLAATAAVLAIGMIYLSEPAPLALAVAMLAVLSIVAAWQPVVILGFVAASLPLYHQPFEMGTSVLAPSELFLVAAIVGTAVRTVWPVDFRAVQEHILSGLERLVEPFSLIAVLGLFALGVVGVALLTQVDDADARAAGLRELRWTIIEPLAFVALLTWNVTRRRERAFLVGAFAAGGLIAALWGLIDAAAGGGVSVSGIVRADGPFPHPNAFALYLLRPVVLAAAFLVITRSKSPILWTLCGIAAIGLVASFSRSAALGIIVAWFLLWPWLTQRLRVLSIFGAGALVVGMVVAAGDRAVGTSGTDSLALRLDIWSSGLEMIRDRPILGYGPDQFLYVYTPRYIDPAAWAERFTAHGHNLLIDAWVRVGIIGAVFVVLALLVIAFRALASRRGATEGRIDVVAVPAVLALAAAGMQGMVDNGYFVHDLAMSAWLLAWLAFSGTGAAAQRGVRLHEGYRDRRRGTRRLAPL